MAEPASPSDSLPSTLFDKLWRAHVVREEIADTPAVLYIDLHLVHEVTSPQGFDTLRERGLAVRRPDRTLATLDHSTPTAPPGADGERPYITAQAKAQVQQLITNCDDLARVHCPSVFCRSRAVTSLAAKIPAIAPRASSALARRNVVPIMTPISPSKSTRDDARGMTMGSPSAMTALGGLRKSSGADGTSFPSSAAWSR
jgi:hypothetical protein